MWVTSSINNVLKPNAIALGNFDGLHRGHQKVLQPLREANKDNGPLYKTVVSFNPHPREFFSGEKRQLLTPLEEKIEYLEKLSIDQLILLPFDRELAALSPQEFVSGLLIEQLEAKLISVGQDFRFGHQRQGDALELQKIADQFKVAVKIVSLENSPETARISSSLVREALATGKVEQANQMLGRHYSITGTVIAGHKLGREIGFPTANLAISPSKFLPKQGVYLVKVQVPGSTQVNLGVMNLGLRPTVNGKNLSLEVHILNWSGDLYDKVLTVSLEAFLRPEQKFSSLEALKAQIHQDINQARKLIEIHQL